VLTDEITASCNCGNEVLIMLREISIIIHFVLNKLGRQFLYFLKKNYANPSTKPTLISTGRTKEVGSHGCCNIHKQQIGGYKH